MKNVNEQSNELIDLMNSEAKETIALKQKIGSINCYAVAVAMATGKSIEKVEVGLGGNPPYTDLQVFKYMLELGYILGYIYQGAGEKIRTDYNLMLEYKFKNNPSFVCVKSKNIPGQTHAMYWNGEKLFDPDPRTENGKCLSEYEVVNLIPINKIDQ